MLKRDHAVATVVVAAALVLSACSPAGRGGRQAGAPGSPASTLGQPPKIVSVDTDPALTSTAPGQGAIIRDDLVVFEPNPSVLADADRVAREVPGLPKYTRVVGWVDDSTVLALAGSNPIAFDVRTGAYRALGKNAWWALLSPDRSLLAYRDEGGVHVVKASQKEWGQEVVTLPTGGERQPRSVVGVWWSPDGSRLLAADEAEEVGQAYWVFDLKGRAYQALNTDQAGYYGAAAAGWLDTDRIAFTQAASRSRSGATEYREAGYRADLAVFNLADGSYKRLSDVADGVFLQARQVMGTSILAHRSEENAAQGHWELWDATTRRSVQIDIPGNSPVLAVSSDAKRLAFVTPLKAEGSNTLAEVGIYDVPTGVRYPLGKLRHGDERDLTFSPDGGRLAISASINTRGQQTYLTWVLDLKLAD